MDTSSVPLLDFGLTYQWCSQGSDSDLSSLSSPETLSPVPSMDSSLSPSYQHPVGSTLQGDKTGYSQGMNPVACTPARPGRKAAGRTRATRIRSKQRESASEKEKLRMRDLTKALHHLRTYLPPSVAPAGQTLTKIETLRLTIRYISYLSAQLGLSEEVLFQRRDRGDSSASETSSSPDILSYVQSSAHCPTMAGQWAQHPGQDVHLGQSQYLPQLPSQTAALPSGSCSFGVEVNQYNGRYNEEPQGALQSSPATHQACYQMYSKDFCSPLFPREYWG